MLFYSKIDIISGSVIKHIKRTAYVKNLRRWFCKQTVFCNRHHKAINAVLFSLVINGYHDTKHHGVAVDKVYSQTLLSGLIVVSELMADDKKKDMKD